MWNIISRTRADFIKDLHVVSYVNAENVQKLGWIYNNIPSATTQRRQQQFTATENLEEASRKRVIKFSEAKRNRRPFMPLFVRTRDFQNKSRHRRIPYIRLSAGSPSDSYCNVWRYLFEEVTANSCALFFDRLVFTVEIIMYCVEFIHAM